MPPPPNTTSLTAQAVTSNVTFSLDVSGIVADPDFEVWFKYTTETANRLISIWAHAPVASNYDPRFESFLGPASAPVPIPYDGNTNRTKMIPVDPLTEYFFKVIQTNTGVTPNANLEFTAYKELGGGTPQGALLISSDGEPFPMISVSPATGEIYGHVQFINGEAGAMLPLPNGAIAHTNKTTGGINFYDKNLNLVVAIPSSTIQTDTQSNITTDRINKFYVQYVGINGVANAIVYQLSDLGVVLNSWSIPGMIRVGEMAVSRDNTIMYMTTAGTNNVRRWDLVGSAFLADIYTPPANHIVATDLLVMADTTILIPVRQTIAPFNQFVEHIDAAGTFINQIDHWGGGLGTPQMNHLAHAIGETSFYVWEKLVAGGGQVDIFKEIRISDGAILSDVTLDDFDNDGDNGAPLSDTLDAFGPMNSCPLMIAMGPLPTTVNGGPPPGIFIPRPGRRFDHDQAIPNPTFRTGLLP